MLHAHRSLVQVPHLLSLQRVWSLYKCLGANFDSTFINLSVRLKTVRLHATTVNRLIVLKLRSLSEHVSTLANNHLVQFETNEGNPGQIRLRLRYPTLSEHYAETFSSDVQRVT